MMMTTCECDLFITFFFFFFLINHGKMVWKARCLSEATLFSMPTGGVAQYLVDL